MWSLRLVVLNVWVAGLYIVANLPGANAAECAGATIDGSPVAVCQLPGCAEEDGNPDGQPCLWTDHSGAAYYVESTNYR